MTKDTAAPLPKRASIPALILGGATFVLAAVFTVATLMT